jgi:hypothetical protein
MKRNIILCLVVWAILFACKDKEPAPDKVELLTRSAWMGDTLSVEVKPNTTSPFILIAFETFVGADTYTDGQNIEGVTVTFNADGTLLFQNTGSPDQSGTWQLTNNDSKLKLTGTFEALLGDLLEQLPPDISPPPIPDTFDVKVLDAQELILETSLDWTVKVDIFGTPTDVPLRAKIQIRFER